MLTHGDLATSRGIGLIASFISLDLSIHCIKIQKAYSLNVMVQAGRGTDMQDDKKQNIKLFQNYERMGYHPRKGFLLNLTPKSWVLVAHAYDPSLLGKLRLGDSWFKASPSKQFMRPPHLQSNQSKIDWMCGSSSTAPSLQVQSPEFKPQ
jgi:hypothetical protein